MKEIQIGVSERGCCWIIIEDGKKLEEGEFKLDGKRLRKDRWAKWNKEKGIVVRDESGNETIYDGFFLIIQENRIGRILTNVFGKAQIYPVKYFSLLILLLPLLEKDKKLLYSKVENLVISFIEKYIEKEEKNEG